MTAAVDLAARARELTAGWSDEAKAEFAAKIRAKARRLRTIRECPTPADLAARFDPNYVRTPAVNLVSDQLRDLAREVNGRLVISLPPQEMKTTLLRSFVFWLLIDDPARRIVFASYASGLARTSGRMIRGMIETHGDDVGLAVDRSHADASDWQLQGHRGGLLSVGVGGSLTGRPADVLVIDDPLRNQQDADSAVIRERLHEWWSAVARTRLAPGAPVVIVQTRWVEDDLAGRMISEGWPSINIPALADGQTDDALAREPGEYLTSTRGRTPADWEAIRRDVGERTWAALFQGRPAPLEGGVFKTAWFDTWRVHELPPGCNPPTVVCDPADNPGSGDEAGIVLATSHPTSGKVYLLDDLSGHYTVAQWARLALLTCVRRGAPSLAYERSLSQLQKRIRDAWQILHQQATALHKTSGDQDAALTRLSRADDQPEAREEISLQLAEITDDVDGILSFGPTGPRLREIVAKGSKATRMQLVSPLFETGRAAIVGRLPQVEHQLTTWQVGQDSPDRADAAVHAATLLAGMSSAGSLGRAQDRVPTSSTGGRSRASIRSSSRLTRITKR